MIDGTAIAMRMIWTLPSDTFIARLKPDMLFSLMFQCVLCLIYYSNAIVYIFLSYNYVIIFNNPSFLIDSRYTERTKQR